jgi:hypothetical protein
MEAVTQVASRGALRHLLTGFCALTALAWAASLVFVSVDLVLASRRLGNLGPVAVGLVFIAVELGGALVARWRIRKATDILASGWTVVAVVAALFLVLVNTFMGVSVA